MKALEATGNIDNEGFLKLEKPLMLKNKKVKVIILVPEEEVLDDLLWRQAIATNAAFDFLNDEAEDIYTLEDGKPFQCNN